MCRRCPTIAEAPDVIDHIAVAAILSVDTNRVIDTTPAVSSANDVKTDARVLRRALQLWVMSFHGLQLLSLPLRVLLPGVRIPVMVLSLLLRPITSSVTMAFCQSMGKESARTAMPMSLTRTSRS